MSTANLIRSGTARMQRAAENRQLILDWLADEIFSTASLLTMVLGGSRRRLHAPLHRLEADGVVASHSIRRPRARALIVWGLTQAGAFEVSPPDKPDAIKPFRPSRLSLMTLEHSLGVQHARLKARAAGWQVWHGTHSAAQIAGSDPFKTPHGGVAPYWPKTPDALAARGEGDGLIAIEYERTAKSPTRYREIMADYLQLVAQEKVRQIHYICPDPVLARRLMALWRSTDSVRIGPKRWPVQDKHRAAFRAFALDDWPNNP